VVYYPSSSEPNVTLSVPNGALSELTTITIQSTSGFPVDRLLAPGSVVDLMPDGLSLSKPAVLTLVYDPAEVTVSPQSNLRVHKLVNGAWEAQPGTVNPSSHTVTTSLSSFSVYGVVALAPSVSVNPTTVSVAEPGGTAAFTVVLGAEPTGSVAVDVSSNDPGEALLGPSGSPSATVTLTFTPSNWYQLQNVQVVGQDEYIADGDQAVTLDVRVNASLTLDSSGYADLTAGEVDDVIATVTDDDKPGIYVSPTSGLETTEAGGTDSFQVKLTSQPLTNVAIQVSTGDATEGRVQGGSSPGAPVSAITLTFTPSNWSQEQPVTVVGWDDPDCDGNQPYSIAVGPGSSADSIYNGRTGNEVSAENFENEYCIIPSPTNLTTTESGGTDTFAVSLTAQPTADVSLDITSPRPDEGKLIGGTSPTSEATTITLTFTSSNWQTSQQVTVVGKNDLGAADGDQTYDLAFAPAVSADFNYNGFVIPVPVTVTNTDNDCGYTVNLTIPNPVPPEGNTYVGSVDATFPNCSWTVGSDRSWIHVTQSVTQGSGSVTVLVDPNNTSSSRSGNALIAGQSIPINQAEATCTYSVTGLFIPDPVSASGYSDSGTVTPNLPDCSPAVSSTQAWIHVTKSTPAPNGSVIVTVLIDPNTTNNGGRSGTANIAGQSFPVSQSGETCTYDGISGLVIPDPVSKSGYTDSATLTPNFSDCSPAVSDNQSWISTSKSVPGANGSVTVTVTVDENTTNSGGRSGTASIAGTNYDIIQSGGSCTFSGHPAIPDPIPAQGGTWSGTINKSFADCTWTISNNSFSWVTITTSGSSVTVKVSANETTSSRYLSITIAGKSYSNRQERISFGCQGSYSSPITIESNWQITQWTSNPNLEVCNGGSSYYKAYIFDGVAFQIVNDNGVAYFTNIEIISATNSSKQLVSTPARFDPGWDRASNSYISVNCDVDGNILLGSTDDYCLVRITVQTNSTYGARFDLQVRD
jgi:hypothetical protein